MRAERWMRQQTFGPRQSNYYYYFIVEQKRWPIYIASLFLSLFLINSMKLNLFLGSHWIIIITVIQQFPNARANNAAPKSIPKYKYMNNYVVIVICYPILCIVRRARAASQSSTRKRHQCVNSMAVYCSPIFSSFCLHDLINGFCEWALHAPVPFQSIDFASFHSHWWRCCCIQMKIQIILLCGVSYAVFILLSLLLSLLSSFFFFQAFNRCAVCVWILRCGAFVWILNTWTHIFVVVAITAISKCANSFQMCYAGWLDVNVNRGDGKCIFSIRSNGLSFLLFLNFNLHTRSGAAIRNKCIEELVRIPPQRI